MAAVVEFASGHAVVAMGSEQEVRAALADESLLDADGWCLLRFAFEPATFSVDPARVVGVHGLTDCEAA
jgi:hypothetical protein